MAVISALGGRSAAAPQGIVLTAAAPREHRRHRIHSAAPIGMAATEAEDREDAAAQWAMQFDRFTRIFGTRRPVAARVANPGRQQEPISRDQVQQRAGRRRSGIGRDPFQARDTAAISSSAPVRSSPRNTTRPGRSLVAGSASGRCSRTLRSAFIPAAAAARSMSSAKPRKASRAMRLTSARSTARRAIRLLTVRPSRAPGWSDALQ